MLQLVILQTNAMLENAVLFWDIKEAITLIA